MTRASPVLLPYLLRNVERVTKATVDRRVTVATADKCTECLTGARQIPQSHMMPYDEIQR